MNEMIEKPWYEDPFIRDIMGLMGARAMRSIMAGFKSNMIYSGENGLKDVSRFLDMSLHEEEKRILIIADSFTQKFSKKFMHAFKNYNFEFRIWDGCIPEVPYPTIEEGVKICEEFKPTVIVGLGGGSVLDTAKVVNIKYERPELNLLQIDAVSGSIGLHKKIKYLLAIPTTIGTGSEVTTAAIVNDTRRKPHKKIGIDCEDILPNLVVLHPDFVKDLPPFLIMGTGLDTFAHAVGAYTSNWNNPLTSAINLTAIKETVKYLPRLIKYQSKDIEAWEHMQWAALMAGLGFSNSMPGIDHAMGHSFGAVFDAHHGMAVGMFTPQSVAWQGKVTERWKDLCPLFELDITNMSRERALEALIEEIQAFIHKVNGPISVKEIEQPKIEKKEYQKAIPLMAEFSLNDIAHLASYRPLKVTHYEKMFEAAWDSKKLVY